MALVLVAVVIALPAAGYFLTRSVDRAPTGRQNAPRSPQPAPQGRSKGALPACAEGSGWTKPPEKANEETAPHDDTATATAEQFSDTLTRDARSEAGLPTLLVDDVLRRVARLHSEDMSASGFFSHDAPDGRTPGQRVHDGHRTLVGEVGENIWMCRGCWTGDAQTAAEAIVTSADGWMHSPGHRANILRPTFTHTAVGIAQHGRDIWATQLFAATRGRLFAPIPANVRADECLLVEVTPYPATSEEPSAFDLVRVDTAAPIVDATPLGHTQLVLSRGRYRTRFHFPVSDRRYEIVSGPNLEIQ